MSKDTRSDTTLACVVDYYVGVDTRQVHRGVRDYINLHELGFGRARPKATAHTGYDHADLPKLYLYG